MKAAEINKLKELFYAGEYELVYTLIDGMDIDYIELDFIKILDDKSYLEDIIPIKNTDLFLDLYKKNGRVDAGLSLYKLRVVKDDACMEFLKCKDFIIKESKKTNKTQNICFMQELSSIEISKIIFNVKI